jgi:hypothetical protein
LFGCGGGRTASHARFAAAGDDRKDHSQASQQELGAHHERAPAQENNDTAFRPHRERLRRTNGGGSYLQTTNVTG